MPYAHKVGGLRDPLGLALPSGLPAALLIYAIVSSTLTLVGGIARHLGQAPLNSHRASRWVGYAR